MDSLLARFTHSGLEQEILLDFLISLMYLELDLGQRFYHQAQWLKIWQKLAHLI